MLVIELPTFSLKPSGAATVKATVTTVTSPAAGRWRLLLGCKYAGWKLLATERLA